MSDENIKTAIKYAVEERDEARRNATAWERRAEQAERERDAILRERNRAVAQHEECARKMYAAQEERDAALARERRLREVLRWERHCNRNGFNTCPELEEARKLLTDEPEPSDDTAPEPANPWRTHTGSEPPPDLAPAQMVEWQIDPRRGCDVAEVRRVPWVGPLSITYRPLHDPDGLPYVSGEGLEPWAEYVATDEDHNVWQYSLIPCGPRIGDKEWRQAGDSDVIGRSRARLAPATHAIPGDWRQSLAKVWREG